MKKVILGLASSIILASSLNAFSFKKDSLKLTFEGYKTDQFIATAGEFTDVTYNFSKDTKSLESYLSKAKIVVKPSSAFMGEGNDLITENITKVFFPTLLGKQNIQVNIQNVVVGDETGLISAKISIGKESTIIPLRYTIDGKKFTAKGQLDLHNFKNASKALRALSDVAPGHGNISWSLVDLSFNAELE